MLSELVARLRGVVGRLLPGEGLREQVVKSGVWLTATNVGDRLLQLVSLAVLARILPPSDFGLLGIALVAVHGLQRFTNLGLDAALIQNREDDVDAYLNTAWVLNLTRGAVIAGVAFAAAPVIAGVTNEPRATQVVRVIGVSPLLLQFRNPGTVYFKKDLNFQKQFLYTIGGSVANVVVAVTLALLWSNVWALVFGYMASDLTRAVSSYLLHDYRPWPAFDTAVAAELIGFGKWMTSTRLLHYLIDEGDDAVVAWVLGAASLGFYQLAYRFAMAPVKEITDVVSTVTFPAYSKVQEDIEQLRTGLFRTVRVTTVVSFPVGFGLAASAPTFVEAFLGTRWLPMVPAMQIIAINGVLISFTSAFGSVWMARDRPDILTKIALVRLPVMVAVLVPAAESFGITGAAAAIVAVYVFPTLPLDVHFVVKQLETSYSRLLAEVQYPLVASAGMGAVVWAVERRIDLAWPVVEFGLLVVVGAVTFLAAVVVLERQFDWGLERDVRVLVDAVS